MTKHFNCSCMSDPAFTDAIHAEAGELAEAFAATMFGGRSPSGHAYCTRGLSKMIGIVAGHILNGQGRFNLDGTLEPTVSEERFAEFMEYVREGVAVSAKTDTRPVVTSGH